MFGKVARFADKNMLQLITRRDFCRQVKHLNGKRARIV